MTEEENGLTMARIMMRDVEEQVRIGMVGLVTKFHQGLMSDGEIIEPPSDMITVLCNMNSSKISSSNKDEDVRDGELCVFTNRLPMIMTDDNPHRDMLESMIGMAQVRPIQTMAWMQDLERCFDGQEVVDRKTFERVFLSVVRVLGMEFIDVEHACLRGLLESLDVVGVVRTLYAKSEDGMEYVVQSYVETPDWFEMTTQTINPKDKVGLWMDPLVREYNGDIEELGFRCLQNEGVMRFQYTVPVPVGQIKSFQNVRDQIQSIRRQMNAYVLMQEHHRRAQQDMVDQINAGFARPGPEEE